MTAARKPRQAVQRKPAAPQPAGRSFDLTTAGGASAFAEFAQRVCGDADPQAPSDAALTFDAVLRGEAPLLEALEVALMAGVPVPEGIAQAMLDGIDAYMEGRCADLGEALGSRLGGKAERKAWARASLRQSVRLTVDALHRDGAPKLDPSQHEGSAFELAARLLRLSPSTVYAIYRGRR